MCLRLLKHNITSIEIFFLITGRDLEETTTSTARPVCYFSSWLSARFSTTIDLYLPALPQMVEVFNTDQSMVNLTLSSYFVTYAVGLLFWGPLSEKFGRVDSIDWLGELYGGDILCNDYSIEQLISARIFQRQACHHGIATAIVKDLYEGRTWKDQVWLSCH